LNPYDGAIDTEAVPEGIALERSRFFGSFSSMEKERNKKLKLLRRCSYETVQVN